MSMLLKETLGAYFPWLVWLLVLNSVLLLFFMAVMLSLPWLLQYWLSRSVNEASFTRTTFLPLLRTLVSESRALRMDVQALSNNISLLPSQGAVAKAVPAAAAEAALPPAATKYILVLEDDPSIGAIMIQMIRRLGYEATLAPAGEDALEAYNTFLAKHGVPYLLALFDLTIHGGLGGRETFRLVKASHSPMKVVACSGYIDDQLNQELLAEGFVDVLRKPFNAQILRATIEKNMALAIASAPPPNPVA